MKAAKKKATRKKAAAKKADPPPEAATTAKPANTLEALTKGLMKALPKEMDPFMRRFHAERIAEVKLRLKALNKAAREKLAKGDIPEARLIAAIGAQEKALDKLLDAAGLGVRVDSENQSFI